MNVETEEVIFDLDSVISTLDLDPFSHIGNRVQPLF